MLKINKKNSEITLIFGDNEVVLKENEWKGDVPIWELSNELFNLNNSFETKNSNNDILELIVEIAKENNIYKKIMKKYQTCDSVN